jgi:hypothetical protein
MTERTNFGNLYPYGTAYNDSVFIAAGDESTHRIPLQAGFLFFGEHYSSAFVSFICADIFDGLINILAS